MQSTSVQPRSTNRTQADESEKPTDGGSPWTVGQIMPIGLAMGVLLAVITVLLG